MPLGLVRLRNLSAQCMVYFGANIKHRFFKRARAERTCKLRDVTIARDGKTGQTLCE